MDLPAYDVVIPCHNRAHVVADAVASALAQSHPPARVVVVDDASRDHGHLVARRLMAVDGRVDVTRHERNLGASAARNTGAALCASRWIAFLDSDDLWLPDAAATLLAHGVAHDLDVVVGMFARVVGGGAPGPAECGWRGGSVRDALRAGGAVGPSWTIMRRAAFDAAGGFDPSYRNCNDWDFYVRVGATGARFGRCEALVAHYRTVAGPRLVDEERALDANGARVRLHPWLADPDRTSRAAVLPHPETCETTSIDIAVGA